MDNKRKLIQFGTIWPTTAKSGKKYFRLNFLRSKVKFPVFDSISKTGLSFKGLYVGPDEVESLISELEATIEFLKNGGVESNDSEEERF